MANITFPVYSWRNIEHPFRGIKCYMAMVPARNLPVELDNWRNINPRDANPRDYVSKAIRRTINENPTRFPFLNRGLAVIARSAGFQPTKDVAGTQGEVTLRFDDPGHHGLLDGGHTFDQVMIALQERQNGELNDLYVKLEVLTGFDDLEEIRSVSEARNTSIQVKEEGLLNINLAFEGIKEVLAGQTYANFVAYSEFELDGEGKPKPIPILDVLACLMCFDIATFTDEKHPLVYGQRKRVINHFKGNKEQMEMLYPLLPDILKLKDTIYLETPKLYNKEFGSTAGGFGHLRGVSVEKEPEKLYFINGQSKYLIANPYIWPIFAAFRILLKKNRGRYIWDRDPFQVFREVGGKLVRKNAEHVKQHESLTDVGKDATVWENIYMTFERLVAKAG